MLQLHRVHKIFIYILSSLIVYKQLAINTKNFLQQFQQVENFRLFICMGLSRVDAQYKPGVVMLTGKGDVVEHCVKFVKKFCRLQVKLEKSGQVKRLPGPTAV